LIKKKSDILVLTFFILLIAVGFAAVLNLYLTKGVSWDFVSHYLNAETVLKQGFYSHIAFLGNSSIIENNGFYFEAARAPLSSTLMALSMLSSRNIAIPIYLAILFALLGIALWSVSKSLGISPLLGAALMISPYLLKFTFLFNSTEILSLTFVLLTVAFVAEKRSEAGIFMALAGLAKYTSLIFLPLLLLLGKPKKIFYSLVFFAVVTLPWILFNYIFFGNPVYSYYNAIVVAVSSTVSNFISLKVIEVLLEFLVIPSILLLSLALGSFINGRANKKETGKTAMRDFIYGKAFLIISFLALGFADLFILGMHNSTFDQERFGYFFYAAFAVAIAFAFSSDRLNLSFNVRKLKFNTHTIMPYALFVVSLFFILLLLHNEPMPWFSWMSQASNNPVLRNAVLAINEAGLSNCRVVSNDWVYLKFLGIKAFSPFYYNSTIARYPIVAFDTLGTPPNYIRETNISKTITYQNYSILFPKNYICQ
jgi:hypothetical protein